MKKLLCLAGLLCAASLMQVHAAPKGTTLEQFMKYHKGEADKKGGKFNEAHYKKLFANIDANNDGELSKEEKKDYWAKK